MKQTHLDIFARVSERTRISVAAFAHIFPEEVTKLRLVSIRVTAWTHRLSRNFGRARVRNPLASWTKELLIFFFVSWTHGSVVDWNTNMVCFFAVAVWEYLKELQIRSTFLQLLIQRRSINLRGCHNNNAALLYQLL